jgi:hypothetical protein
MTTRGHTRNYTSLTDATVGAGTYEILIPVVGLEALVDVIRGSEISEHLPPALLVVDNRGHHVLIAAANAFGLIKFGTLGLPTRGSAYRGDVGMRAFGLGCLARARARGP